MMPTDKERREVAARLRSLPIDVYGELKEWHSYGIDVVCQDQADYYQLHDVFMGCFPADNMHPCDYEEFHDRLADLIDPEEPAVPSDERDTRIPYRLGTDHYCVYEDDGGFVHMGDTVEVCEDCYDGQLPYTGELLSVEYGSDGFISFVRVANPSNENEWDYVDCEGVFFRPEKEVNRD